MITPIIKALLMSGASPSIESLLTPQDILNRINFYKIKILSGLHNDKPNFGNKEHLKTQFYQHIYIKIGP